MLEEVKEVFKNDLRVAYIGRVCGWEGVRPQTRVCGRTLHVLERLAAHSMCWSVWPGFDSYTSS